MFFLVSLQGNIFNAFPVWQRDMFHVETFFDAMKYLERGSSRSKKEISTELRLFVPRENFNGEREPSVVHYIVRHHKWPSTKLLGIGRQITGRVCWNYDVVHFRIDSTNRKPATAILCTVLSATWTNWQPSW